MIPTLFLLSEPSVKSKFGELKKKREEDEEKVMYQNNVVVSVQGRIWGAYLGGI